MYNPIPGEGTSKRAIVVTLLCCVALISALAAGYFAWLLEEQRIDQVVLEEVSDAQEEPVADTLEEEPEEVETPVFTYPVIVQPERRTEIPDGWGSTLLSAMLDDWAEANKDSGYCVHIRDYVTDKKILSSRGSAPGYAYLADEGVRAALKSYFAVSAEQEQDFFNGIDAVMDDNDAFAQDYAMCEGGSGARKFLLLDDVRTTILEDGSESVQSYPEVLEWSENSTLGSSWIVYPPGEYRVMDGYRFYPDWYGNVIVQTGYGDAGYANREMQLLEVSSGVPMITVIEKCNVEPTEDYEDSITTCEIRYTE